MEEIDIKELLTIFWKKKVFIIITIFLFIIIGFLKCILFDKILSYNKPIYSVSEMNIVVTSGKISSGTDYTINKKDVPELYSINTEVTTEFTENLFKTYNDILKSNSVITPVIQEYNLNMTPSEFANHITLVRSVGSDYIRIIVAMDNDKINDITNSLGNSFINCIKNTYLLDGNITIIDNSYTLSNNDISQLTKLTTSNTDINEFDSFIKSLYPTLNIKNIIIKNIIIFAFIGFIISCGYILILESFDETIKSKNDIENLNLNILSRNNNSVITAKLNNSKIISHINLANDENENSINLAKNFTKQNKKILYISLIKNDQIISKKGLYDYLKFINDNESNNSKITFTNYLANSNNNYLDLLSCGNIDTDFIFDEKTIEKFITDIKEKYDHLIIELDNIETDVNSLLMLNVTNTVYISCKARKTKLEKLRSISKELTSKNINILGTIFIEKN